MWRGKQQKFSVVNANLAMVADEPEGVCVYVSEKLELCRKELKGHGDELMGIGAIARP